MLLQKLKCFHFKNYESIELDFAAQLNCVIGSNGAGKTNLLDAIHYLSLAKSAFNNNDTHNILHDTREMAIQGYFLKFEKYYDIKCIIHPEKGKILQNNGKVYERIREHIGQFPIVFTTPYDADLIQGISEIRRKFFDAILCQIDSNYLVQLAQYQKIIKQRNSFLRMYAGRYTIDRILIASYDEQILPLARKLYTARRNFIDFFYPLLKSRYKYFVEAPEIVQLNYVSDVESPQFEQMYLDNLKEDLLAQRTILGIHRDEFLFTLNGHPLKKFGSQGQQKSFIIAMRLAQFACIQEVLQCKPLLLLDDIFDKLDELRIEKLIDLITQQYFGQVWITDAGGSRSNQLIKKIHADKSLIRIDKGKLVSNIIL